MLIDRHQLVVIYQRFKIDLVVLRDQQFDSIVFDHQYYYLREIESIMSYFEF